MQVLAQHATHWLLFVLWSGSRISYYQASKQGGVSSIGFRKG